MTTPYIGEIRWFAFARGAPVGWQLCNGALLSIAQYQTLYTVLGTTYGGDGVNTFGVPDLRARVPIHQGAGTGLSPYVLGQVGGAENVTLQGSQLGGHTHTIAVQTGAATASTPANNMLAALPAGESMYTSTLTGTTRDQMATTTIQPTGQSLPHENCAPTLTINVCIATVGVFPTRN
jgi:microcystin-dependent protein